MFCSLKPVAYRRNREKRLMQLYIRNLFRFIQIVFMTLVGQRGEGN